ncbi:unnamed protein product [Lasius platythorax]|uniref:Uncharacterized protein n=1 Tax=Lasius platythorax TaxID=488582 RepID=A0AAV2P8F0_9HYME
MQKSPRKGRSAISGTQSCTNARGSALYNAFAIVIFVSDKSRALSSPAGVLCYHCGDVVDSDRGKDNAALQTIE